MQNQITALQRELEEKDQLIAKLEKEVQQKAEQAKTLEQEVRSVLCLRRL